MPDEIDIVGLVDGIIYDCLVGKIPPYPKPIVETLARVLCYGTSAACHAVMMVKLTGLVKERLAFLAAQEQAVN